MLDTNFSQIKVVGFDLDQTLYPKSPEIDAAIQKYIYEKISKSLNVTLEEAGIKFKELYQDGRGMSGRRTLLALGFPNEEAENIVQEALENADIAKFLNPNPDLKKLLLNLKTKYELDIITGSRLSVASKKLSKLDLNDIFKNFITDESGSKHSGSSYTLWMSKYPDYNPNQFLYIGDRPKTDYEMPKSMNIKSILVNIKEIDPSLECPQLKNTLEIKNFL